MTYRQDGVFDLVSSKSASNSANISFTNLTKYINYLLIWRSVWADTLGANLQLLTSQDNGVSYATTSYFGGINYNAYNSTTFTNINSTANLPLSGPNAAGFNNAGYAFINNISSGDVVIVNGQVSYHDSVLGPIASGNIGGQSSQTGVNAIRLKMSSGNMTIGTFDLYGIRES